ncbi:MAG: NUDIX hydrolase [Vicinamibacteria bacterium]
MKIVFKGPVFSVESGVMKEPGGVKARRDIVRHSGSVAILPIDALGRLTLIRQFRCAFGTSVIELPAGRIDKGETPLQAAKRELSEEIGLGARTWTRLLKILPTPGFCDETVTIFRASDLFEKPGEPDADERIEAVRMTLPEALRLLSRQKIEDAKTVVALLIEKQRRG